MPDQIIIDKDIVVFTPVFGNAVVAVKPGVIRGTGKTTIKGKPVCVKDDIKQVSVTNCAYVAGVFVGGFGTLKIKKLQGKQLTKKVSSGGKEIILKGSIFEAEFQVTIKAKDPATTNPDPMSTYKGFGKFLPVNKTIKAT
ncbi:hypothetical protein [Fulvivirga sediminis]|uniref:Uncharacterized protein n=1 Tax=Fulvivirga sediminis TaxID=2803949 RepID=A0A937F395_9BACT|nr:hypothetical protein [Fulvivirga sediminis]MBL3655536.1 hypothetical protein [Fulvivirga sediminis]